ncbi:MAG: DUF3772 domain-containing protein, partial [Pseudomonadota bacterium]
MRWLRKVFVAVFCCALAGSAVGQVVDPDTGRLDYEAWEILASEVEQVIAAGSLSTSDLEELRAEVAEARAAFLDAESANAARIETIENQISALGPPPEEGSTEPDGVASLRAELETRLAEVREPRVRATQAFTRANGLISEIDDLIRARSARTLFEASPTPLNPLNWPGTLVSLRDVAAEIGREVRVRTAFELRRTELRQGLPRAVALFLFGVVLLLRGRAWTLRATQAITERMRGRGRQALAFFVSFTQLLVPFLGL